MQGSSKPSSPEFKSQGISFQNNSQSSIANHGLITQSNPADTNAMMSKTGFGAKPSLGNSNPLTVSNLPILIPIIMFIFILNY